MGLWLQLVDPSEPNPNQSDPGWHVSKQYSGQSHVPTPDDTHSVDPS